jgi:hypothetical protein
MLLGLVLAVATRSSPERICSNKTCYYQEETKHVFKESSLFESSYLLLIVFFFRSNDKRRVLGR